MDFDYSIFKDNLLSTLTYTFLAASIVSLWVRKQVVIWSLLGIAIGLGLYTGRLQWLSLLSIGALGGLSYLFYHAKNKKLRLFLGSLFTLLSMFILFHKIPGFSNWQIMKEAKTSLDAMPYNLFLNFDKPLIGLFILGFGSLSLLQSRSETMLAIKKMAPFAFFGIVIIMLLSILMGFVKLDLKSGSSFFIWALNNLLFVCFAEEVFFRGFIQQNLSTYLKKYRYGDAVALIIASLLFISIHFFGIKYILLAGVASIIYGLVYLKTKRIEASIFTHFTLNTIHFLGFTYPALA